MMLSTPLTPKNPDGVLRALLPSRISTLKQDAENMAARQDDVEGWVRHNYVGEVELRRLSEQASGWLAERPTMDEAMLAINSGWCDVVVVSEMRELFRNPQFQWRFLQDCKDAEVRVVVLNDAIDTSDDNWEVSAHTAVLRHGMFVPETRRRVRRKAAHSFEKGGMVQKVRFAYVKLTKEEAASGKLGPVGLRVAKIDSAKPIVLEMRRRVVAGESPDDIAAWLNDDSISPGPYVKSKRWTGRLVEAFLRDPILSGMRRRRMVIYSQIYKTGKSRRARNPDGPQFKHWPELAYMTDLEQAEMIAALDLRSNGQVQPSGSEHPLFRRPRAWSLWPGQHARCICGGRMYRFGTFLRCENTVRNGPRTCWNHVQVPFDQVRTRVLPWVLSVIDQHPPCREMIVDFAWTEARRQRHQARHVGRDLDSQINKLRAEAANLTKAIRSGGRLKILIADLTACQSALDELEQKREQLSKDTERDDILTKDEIAARLPEVLDRLALESFRFADLLRRLIPEFVIVPVQALDTPLVRPRAHLTLRLDAWCHGPEPAFATSIHIDLFDLPQHIEHLTRCVTLRQSNPTLGLAAMGDRLGIGKMTVKRALAYARRMEQLGMTETHRVLQSPPAEASRWGKRNR